MKNTSSLSAHVFQASLSERMQASFAGELWKHGQEDRVMWKIASGVAIEPLCLTMPKYEELAAAA